MLYDNKRINRIDYLEYNIEWVIGNYCNFACTYCFDNSNLGTHKPPVKWADAKLMIDNVVYLITEIKKSIPPAAQLQITFSGGEPTTYKHFPKICEVVKDMGIDIMLITNGSMPVKWWRKNMHLFDVVMLSAHTEFTNLDHLKEIIHLFADYPHSRASVAILTGNKTYNKAIEWFKDLSVIQETKPYIDVRLSTIRRTERNVTWEELNDDQLSIVKNLMLDSDRIRYKQEFPRRVSKSGTVRPEPQYQLSDNSWHDLNYHRQQKHITGNWIGYECNAPIQFLSIQEDFRVSKLACGQSIFPEPIYVTDRNFKEKFTVPQPVICSIDAGVNCNCIGLMESNKVWVEPDD